MTEQIGKITLDYKYYPGEDLYCDGVIEDEILDIVKNNPVSDYPRIIEERASWPILYHLSPLRENIVDWIPLDSSMKVLEVGSGCGAITGALARKAGSVTCIDLSKKRSTINAYRHLKCDNVTIHVGNFKDIEPELPNDYDYIFLIGVFEYGQGYMGTNTPYEDFMAILKKHMNSKGRLVIAIENKFGLKYWAGCKEDHFGTFFSGIEDYPDGGGVRTFTRRGLEKIMAVNDVEQYSFYYPYPDYKFMTSIYSDAYLPSVGELSNNLRNFDRDRLLLFDEKNAFDNVIREGMFAEFSNSYLVVIGEPIEVKFSKFSNDRAEKFAIRTDILENDKKERAVFKTALHENALEHIQNIKISANELEKKYEGSRLKINACTLEDDRVELAYVKGKTLEMLLDECLERQDEAGFRQLIEEYMEAIQYHAEMPINDFDLIFSNIIVDENTGDWTIIDYEWTFPVALPYEENLFRALYCYLIGAKKRRKLSFDIIKEVFDIEEADMDAHLEKEIEFQHYVTGNRMSMSELYSVMGRRSVTVNDVQKFYSVVDEAKKEKHVQIYLNEGAGFSEDNSYFLSDEECMQLDATHNLILESNILQDASQYLTSKKYLKKVFEFPMEIQQVRLDPYNEPCIVTIQDVSANGEESIPYQTNGLKISDTTYLFTTTDPNITIDLSVIESDKSLSVAMEILPISAEIACGLQEGLQKTDTKKRLPFFRK